MKPTPTKKSQALKLRDEVSFDSVRFCDVAFLSGVCACGCAYIWSVRTRGRHKLHYSATTIAPACSFSHWLMLVTDFNGPIIYEGGKKWSYPISIRGFGSPLGGLILLAWDRSLRVAKDSHTRRTRHCRMRWLFTFLAAVIGPSNKRTVFETIRFIRLEVGWIFISRSQHSCFQMCCYFFRRHFQFLTVQLIWRLLRTY